MLRKFLLLIILAAILLTACGRNREESGESDNRGAVQPTREENHQAPETSPETPSETPPAIIQSGGTLRILAPRQFAQMLDTAGLEISRTLGVELDITFFDTGAETPHWSRTLPQSIANGDFDLFFADPRFPLYEMIQDELLVDIFTLADFSHHAFYFEALRTLTVDNSLHLFPLGFGFQYVSINSNWAPQWAVERFNSYNTITVSQMMDIYLEMARRHTIHHEMEVVNLQIISRISTLEGVPGPISLRLSNCRDHTFPEFMVWNAIMDYVDLNNRTANLTDPGFVAFLEKLLELYIRGEEPDEIPAYRRFRYNITPRRSYRIYALDVNLPFPWMIYLPTRSQFCYYWESLEYMFMVHNEFVNPLTPLAPISTFSVCWSSFHNHDEIIRSNPCGDEAFQRFIPLVDEAGRLRTNINTTYPWKTVGIASGGNTGLAWDFVSRYLLPASICADNNYGVSNLFRNIGTDTIDSPIDRSIAPGHLLNVLTMLPEWWELVYEPTRSEWLNPFWHPDAMQASPADIGRAIERVLSQIQGMNEMPMAPVALIPFELFEPALHQMFRRFASPEDTARIIHDGVVGWLER